MRSNPAQLEIMRSYFNAIATGMGHVIERTSFTTFVKESADFATALATPEGEFYMYPKSVGVTIFLGLSLRKAIESVGEEIEEGDIIITNDPYTTDGLATHLPDVHVFKPIFHDGKLVSYAWAFVHVSDVGGLVPASISPTATDVHQEGLRIPPVKLYRKGKPNKDVLAFLRLNSRVADLNEGDINAMVASVNTAESRLHRMIGKFGVNAVQNGIADLLEQAESRSREVLRQIPDGEYSFADYLDDDMVSEVPIRLAVTLRVKDGEITLDFSDSDPQTQTAFNLVTNGQKHSFLYQGLINFIITSDPHIPNNGGITRPFSVIAPKGTLVNPAYPAAVGIRHSITMRMYNVVLGAIGQALPELVPAAGAGQSAIVVLSVPQHDGTRNMAVVEPMGGGGGAQQEQDGIDGIDHSSGFLKNTPIESLEQHIPVLVERYEYEKNTGGAGQYRGGHAITLAFRILESDSMVTARGMERFRFQPWGLAGGQAGQQGYVVRNPEDEAEKLPKIDVLRPAKGDIISITSPGGGGFGPGYLRPVDKVVAEVKDGLLSAEQAAKAYGVILGDSAVDEKATNEARSKMEATKNEAWDFGAFRSDYESVWTAEASAALAVALRSYPANLRNDMKRQVHRHFEVQKKSLTKQDILDVLRQITGEEANETVR
ncbi:hydantoinase B/oxoprolinase family protein [Terribacillus saccharophilus]|uniref:hydantoinase B/oxoprolinase family protein n=1 Tax=Terribacillus saccharophilus TaxID=361277 RepID=UPI002989E2FB|nr:hydantoinase B/oxoprolinase family protein [Terribacillus saccharophilus]MCM3226149.1 hydantoinase B/oxoprolinase family protein [Terribacillus saccharophilus]